MKKQIVAPLGESEDTLVREKGQPDFCKEEGGVRHLRYRTTRQGDQDYWIEVTYVIVDGVIQGFAAEGNDPIVFS